MSAAVDASAALAGPPREAGLPLARIRRPWEEDPWPLATRGFFPFRQKSPAVLATLGLRL